VDSVAIVAFFIRGVHYLRHAFVLGSRRVTKRPVIACYCLLPRSRLRECKTKVLEGRARGSTWRAKEFGTSGASGGITNNDKFPAGVDAWTPVTLKPSHTQRCIRESVNARGVYTENREANFAARNAIMIPPGEQR